MIDLDAMSELYAETRSFYFEPLKQTVYYTDITPLEWRKMNAKHPNWMGGSLDPDAMIDMIIMKALDDKGEPLFSLEHKTRMLRWKGIYLAELFGQLTNVESAEDAEKN